jgi:transcriptional regulator with XRE-family HTH domain
VGRLPKTSAPERAPGTKQARPRAQPETLGDRIRNLRRERGLRLVDMAKMTDLSVSFISQVERGLTNPGMRSLILIADALEVRPHSLLEETPRSDLPWVLTRAADQDEVPNDGGTARTITSNVNPRFNAFDFHDGPRKFYTWYRVAEDLLMIQLAGQLEVEIETEENLILRAGDTLFIRGGTNHRWRQVGRAKSRMLTVLHAPQRTAGNDGARDGLAGQPAAAGAAAKSPGTGKKRPATRKKPESRGGGPGGSEPPGTSRPAAAPRAR